MHPKALILSLFASSVLATPVKRDYVYETDVAVVTEVATVTVTAGGPAAPTHHKHHHHKKPHHNAPAPSPSPYQPAPPPPASPKPHKHHHKKPHPNLPSDPYQAAVVHHHNVHRANHSAPAVEWSDDLAKSAQDIAATCVYEHNTSMDGGNYGQNIAAGVTAEHISQVISNMFYNGEVGAYSAEYGTDNPTNFEQCGHFTQVVWKGTTQVACATQDCSAGGLANVDGAVPPYFTVCNYRNPGNVIGEYAANVLPPLGHPTVSGH